MGWARTVAIAAASIAVAAAGAVFLFRDALAQRAFERQVERNVGRSSAADLGAGLYVYVCGAGSPLPDPTRGGPCLAVVAGDTHLVFDTGSGAARTLTRMTYPLGEVDAVFLTHLHSDHIDGMGELLMQAWVNGGRDAPLPVYGPTGVAEVVGGFNAAYRIDGTYRTAHHGVEIANPAGHGGAPAAITLPAGPGGAAVVYDEAGVTVTAYRVDHAPVEPAFGYRIDYAGRSVSLSGDTVYSPNLVAVSEGVDLLFHEALNAEMVRTMQASAAARGRNDLAKILGDILDYHATPADAARSAEEAGAGRLVLYHTVPPLPSRALDGLFVGDAETIFSGPIDIAADGLIYSLPPGNDTIRVTKAF
jgi:ribonuclease Z